MPHGTQHPSARTAGRAEGRERPPSPPLLDIDHLTLELPATARPLLADVSLRVRVGEVVGLVGESGSGKSTTAKAALGMLPEGGTTTGGVWVEGADVLALRGEKLRAHRARTVAMVHQDPRAALNPVRRVGDFLTERLALAGVTDRGTARGRAVELLDTVGIPDPARRVRQRPHELSGGMLQRVVIAGALAAEPRLLLADEATSALDVTTQAEVLDLLRTLRAERETGMLFITHDLHLAAAYCDRVVVMYAGRIVEQQPARALFSTVPGPRHPYTRGLLDCSPALDDARAEIRPIPGRPPSLADTFPGCPFAARCPEAEPECEEWTPVAAPLEEGGEAACRRLPEAVTLTPSATAASDPAASSATSASDPAASSATSAVEGSTR